MKICRSLALLAVLPSASAFPGGAGRCVVGEAAPSHPAPPEGQGGLLSNGGYSVSVDGIEVPEGESANVLSGTPFEISVTGPAFRGFLIMLAGEPESALEGPDGISQQATTSGCPGVAAQTHTSNTELTEITVTGTIEEVTSTTIELNIVVQFSGGISIFHYTQVPLTVSASDSDPGELVPPEDTDAPPEETEEPTAAPVAITEEPTAAPVAVTADPTAAVPDTMPPTMGAGDTETPTVAPVEETEAPVWGDTEAPVAAPPDNTEPPTSVAADVVTVGTGLLSVLTVGLVLQM